MRPTQRSKVKRSPRRGFYETATIHAILDAHYVCHIGFIYSGHPVVIPTLYGRDRDKIYIHGAGSSRLITSLQTGIDISVAVTIIDGIVLARSAFHHSINYRSVMLFGIAEAVSEDQKSSALKAISDQVLPGRWEEVRRPNKKELKATTVLSIPINEASAKIRTGPPVDDEADYDVNAWAGILPLHINYGTPIPDPKLKEHIRLSDSVSNFLERNIQA